MNEMVYNSNGQFINFSFRYHDISVLYGAFMFTIVCTATLAEM